MTERTGASGLSLLACEEGYDPTEEGGSTPRLRSYSRKSWMPFGTI